MARVAALFESRQAAERAIGALRASGVEANQIGLAIRDSHQLHMAVERTGVEVGEGITTGAVAGGLLGGGLGLLLTVVGAVALPVLGPIVAAGPIAAALAGVGVGAATGGLLGALTAAGVPEEEAEVYQIGVERGGVLVTVDTPAEQELAVRSVMGQFGSLDTNQARNLFASDPSYRLGQDSDLEDLDGTSHNIIGSGSEALVGGVSAVAGGVLGAVVAGPVGAVAGAAIGGAAGAGAAHVAENDEGSSAGPQIGAASGAVVGGAIGAVGGPVGAAIGAAIGGASGSALGDAATHTATEAERAVPPLEADDPNYNVLDETVAPEALPPHDAAPAEMNDSTVDRNKLSRQQDRDTL